MLQYEGPIAFSGPGPLLGEEEEVPYARTDIYKHSFFPDTVRGWNALPAYIISPAESFKDPIARFTSLIRSRD